MSNPIFIARQDTLEQEILPAHWLSQYKLFGEESYTFQDKEIWKKFCMSRAAANDRDMHAEALEEMLTTFSAEHTGKWMLTVYGMDAAVLEGLASMAAVAANALLMHAITNSETAMDAIGTSRIARDAVQASPYYNSYIKENDMAIAKLVVSFANLASAGYSGMAGVAADATAMTAVAASSTAMTAVAASSTAMTAVAASGVALKAIAQAYKKTANMLQFLKAVNASDTLIKRIYNTLTNATALFGATQLGSQDSVENANSWATTSAAPNAFLACACGYYSSGNSVNVTYNGTVIAQKKTGTAKPGSVTSTNVNAITMAPSTFTENGDGYLAVQKFTAK